MPSITDDIDDVLDPILATFRARLEATLVNRAVFAYLRGSAQMVQWGRTKTTDMPIYFEGQPMQQAINYAQSHITKAKLVDGITASTKERLSDIIADGIRNKRGIDGLARDIRNELGWKGNLPSEIKGLSLKDRSEMISQYETADALEQSFIDRSKDMGVTGKRWVVINPCPICEENEAAGVIPIDEEFPSGHIRPPAHPRCLLPGTRVVAPFAVAGVRAFYDGQAVELITQNGYRLAVTPNHMILAPRGFMAAKSLKQGDYVLTCPNTERAATAIDPYYDDIPALVEDIWDALMVKRGMVCNMMPTTPEDFYGDARAFNGDIDIVSPNSALAGNISNAFGLKHISEQSLGLRDTQAAYLAGNGSLFAFFLCLYSGFRNDMRRGSPGLPFFGSEFAHHKISGFGLGSRRNARFEQAPSNPIPINTKSLTERQFGLACQVRSNNISIRECLIPSTLPSNAASFEGAVEGGFAYTELAHKIISRLTGLITADQIVNIREFDFRGHVYDLQTVNHWYIGNNIITHNCNCALAPSMLPE